MTCVLTALHHAGADAKLTAACGWHSPERRMGVFCGGCKLQLDLLVTARERPYSEYAATALSGIAALASQRARREPAQNVTRTVATQWRFWTSPARLGVTAN